MATTRYFVEQVQRKRAYVTEKLCREVLASPLRQQVQPDGRIRYYGRVTLPGEEQSRILRASRSKTAPRCTMPLSIEERAKP